MACDGNRIGWPRAVLFDLDGTLVDSVPAMTLALNRLLREERLAPFSHSDVRRMLGDGTQKLVERAFFARSRKLTGGEHASLVDRLVRAYAMRMTEHSALRSHAADAVCRLAGSGVHVAVISNKPERFLRRLLRQFDLAGCVDVVIGGDSGRRRKPAPDMLSQALERMDVGPRDALMVGDSAADIEAARAVPMAAIAIRGGYEQVPETLGADCVIDDLSGLHRAIATIQPVAGEP